MKKIVCQLLSCSVMVFAIAATPGATAHSRLIHISDVLVCLDGMETVPMDDDVGPTLIAADGSCMVAEPVISI